MRLLCVGPIFPQISFCSCSTLRLDTTAQQQPLSWTQYSNLDRLPRPRRHRLVVTVMDDLANNKGNGSASGNLDTALTAGEEDAWPDDDESEVRYIRTASS